MNRYPFTITPETYRFYQPHSKIADEVMEQNAMSPNDVKKITVRDDTHATVELYNRGAKGDLVVVNGEVLTYEQKVTYIHAE